MGEFIVTGESIESFESLSKAKILQIKQKPKLTLAREEVQITVFTVDTKEVFCSHFTWV